MRVLVTGATGLLGSHVAERLRTRGHAVVALARRTSDRSLVPGVQWAEGDLAAPPETLARALAGCDALVHAAAVVFRRGSWAHYHRVNVEGTERALRAAALAGARRVVHISSVAVYGGAAEQPRVGEEDWRAGVIPANDFYSRSKREAEEAAWRLHAEGAIRLTTVRPVVVYGERDRLFTPLLARLVALPALPLPGGGRSPVPVVYAGNVASAVVAALEREEAVGRAYNLSEDRPLTARELVAAFARELGHRPRLVPIPAAPVRALGALGDAALRLLPRIGRPRLRRLARLLLDGNPYDASRARRDLEWTEHTAHADAIARTAAWWRGRPAAGRYPG